jgi:alpha-tubulin suppressor-like RCC1 family protein
MTFLQDIIIHLLKVIVNFIYFYFFACTYKLLFFLENEIFYMGDNSFGESGIGHDNEIKEITKINYFEKENSDCLPKKIKKIVSTDYCTIFLTSNFYFLIFKNIKYDKLDCKKLYSVGNNRNGQSLQENREICTEIRKINFFKNFNIIDLKNGVCHYLVVTETGDIFGWGSNKHRQLNDSNVDDSGPIKIYTVDKDLLKN